MMKRHQPNHHSGFTLIEVLVGAVLLSIVMMSVNRITVTTLAGNATEKKRKQIEAEIQNNIQMLQRTNSQLTLDAIPVGDQSEACEAPEVFLISRLEQTGGSHYVPSPSLSQRTLQVSNLDRGWRVIEIMYEFDAPEKTLSTETRLVNLHPNFIPNCP